MGPVRLITTAIRYLALQRQERIDIPARGLGIEKTHEISKRPGNVPIPSIGVHEGPVRGVSEKAQGMGRFMGQGVIQSSPAKLLVGIDGNFRPDNPPGVKIKRIGYAAKTAGTGQGKGDAVGRGGTDKNEINRAGPAVNGRFGTGNSSGIYFNRIGVPANRMAVQLLGIVIEKELIIRV